MLIGEKIPERTYFGRDWWLYWIYLPILPSPQTNSGRANSWPHAGNTTLFAARRLLKLLRLARQMPPSFFNNQQLWMNLTGQCNWCGMVPISGKLHWRCWCGLTIARSLYSPHYLSWVVDARSGEKCCQRAVPKMRNPEQLRRPGEAFVSSSQSDNDGLPRWGRMHLAMHIRAQRCNYDVATRVCDEGMFGEPNARRERWSRHPWLPAHAC